MRGVVPELGGTAMGAARPAESSRDLPPIAEVEPSHVMIVDDSAVNLLILRTMLEDMGIRRVTEASNGLECLELLGRGEVPDLILLDVVMPVMDGYETCRRIRAWPGLSDMTIVIQTLLDSVDDRLKAFEAGATDLVIKPIFEPELKARLKVHLEHGLMTRSLKRFRERLSEQLAVASQMQQSLMPAPADVARRFERTGIDFEAFYRPCDEIGGDLWQVAEIDEHRTAVMLFDVNGHGLVAAINAFRLHGVATSLTAFAGDPPEWLAACNRWLARDFQSNVMATGLYGVVDAKAGTFRYASAGWMPPLLCRSAGQPHATVTPLASSGAMLGMLPEIDYVAHEVPFNSDDSLLLYSDGLCVDPSGGELAPDVLAEAVLRTIRPGTGRMLPRLIDALPCRSAGNDDVVVLWLGRRSDPEKSSER